MNHRIRVSIRRGVTLLGMAFAGLSAAHSGAAQAMLPTVFDPVAEAQNFSITQQRQAIYDTLAYQAQLPADSAASTAQALATQAADPGRFFTDDLCWNQGNGCAGDIRLDDWASAGYGLVRPVLFTARDGATISGHVWATVAGPAKRPAIVITNGSVLGASLRGPDLIDWYTTAWFDEYSSAIRMPTRDFSPRAGVALPLKGRSIPATTATRSRSITAHGSTSTWAVGTGSTARTYATAVPE